MSRTEPLLNHPRYVKIKHLNDGGFGKVQLALDLNNQEMVAIKFLPRGNGANIYAERELMTHRILWHDHIVKFREVFLTPYHLGIVLEYAEGGDLLTYIQNKGRLDEDMARWLFQQVIVVVDYLHKMGVANRDIKLENTLLATKAGLPIVKLCDLGYAKHCQWHSQPDSVVGTAQYVAPEILRCKTYDGMIADIWSCGVMLYVMVMGHHPFERQEDRRLHTAAQKSILIRRIMQVDYDIPDCRGLSDELADLMRCILVADPHKRITLEQIKQHPWFQKLLPPGVLEMNQNLTPHQSEQSAEEIKKLLKQAEVVEGVEPMSQAELIANMELQIQAEVLDDLDLLSEVEIAEDLNY